MRVIKFRAWDIKKSIMLPEKNLYHLPARYKINKILLQFIGLHDRNGEDVYEGDIIEWINNANGVSKKCEIIFSGCSFMIRGLETYDCHIPIEIFEEEYFGVRVIGNIYENPDLLKS